MAAMKERCPILCSICKVEFSTRGNLKMHEDIHKGIKFECQYCVKQFSQKRNLTTHVKSVHENARHKCALDILVRHVLAHNKIWMKTTNTTDERLDLLVKHTID